MVTSLSQPKPFATSSAQGIYCLITTATTSNAIASLDTVVWFKPTVPPLRVKHLIVSHHFDRL